MCNTLLRNYKHIKTKNSSITHRKNNYFQTSPLFSASLFMTSFVQINHSGFEESVCALWGFHRQPLGVSVDSFFSSKHSSNTKLWTIHGHLHCTPTLRKARWHLRRCGRYKDANTQIKTWNRLFKLNSLVGIQPDFKRVTKCRRQNYSGRQRALLCGAQRRSARCKRQRNS